VSWSGAPYLCRPLMPPVGVGTILCSKADCLGSTFCFGRPSHPQPAFFSNSVAVCSVERVSDLVIFFSFLKWRLPTSERLPWLPRTSIFQFPNSVKSFWHFIENVYKNMLRNKAGLENHLLLSDIKNWQNSLKFLVKFFCQKVKN
jgi:hypothetical protein